MLPSLPEVSFVRKNSNDWKINYYTFQVRTYRRAVPGGPVFEYPTGGDSTLGVTGVLVDLLEGELGLEFCDEFPYELAFDVAIDGDSDTGCWFLNLWSPSS